MDWQGQLESELIMQYTLLGSALVAFVTGYLMSSYRIMLTIYFIGAGITLLFGCTVWQHFNRNPLEWFEPIKVDTPSSRQLRLKQTEQLKEATNEAAVNPYTTRS